MRIHWIPVVGILLAVSAIPVTAGEILPVDGREERFLELLRKASPLPGDLEADRHLGPGTSFETGLEQDGGLDEIDRLLGRPEILFLGGRSGRSIPIFARRHTVMAPVPLAPSEEIRPEWRLVLAALRSRKDVGEDVLDALAKIRGHPVAKLDPRTDCLTRMVALASLSRDLGEGPISTSGELAPGEDVSLILLAVLRLETGAPGKAVEPLERLTRLVPSHVPAAALLGEALLRSGRPEDAVPVLEAVLDKRPDRHESSLHLARSLLASGSLEKALVELEQLIEQGDLRFGAYILTARVRLRLGEHDAALAACDGASRSRPRSMLPPQVRIGVLLDAGRNEEALKAAATLASRAPKSIQARRTLSGTALRIGNAEVAKRAAVEWGRLTKDGPASRTALARALHLEDKGEEAVLLLTEVLAKHPKYVRAMRVRGDILKDLGRNGEARASYRAFLDQVPEGAAADQVREILKGLR